MGSIIEQMKIVTIVGARPQFIKAAVLSRLISSHKEITEVLIHTGQHFSNNMSDVFFEELEIPLPDYNLNINQLKHGAMTGRMLEKIEEVLLDEKPDWVLVYGDTNSTLAGAIAAKKLNIKLIHVEAGLRSHNDKMPEEINRKITDRISDLLFCPTEQSYNNLVNEGYNNFTKCDIILSGDIMLDAAKYYNNKSKKPQFLIPPEFVLCTIHRAENTDNKTNLSQIIEGLKEISKVMPIILPIHPRTQCKINEMGIDLKDYKILLVDPVSYLEMVYLLQKCNIVITDSGGLQKEAFFFEKFCLTIREETEWVELIDNGFNKLCGHDKHLMITHFMEIITNPKKNFKIDLYGNGNSAEIILMNILNYRY